MRLEQFDEPVVEAHVSSRPRPNLKVAAMLITVAVWPLVMWALPRAVPGGASYSREDAAELAQATVASPALPAPSAGAGRQSGPAPFWEAPPNATVHLKVIIPAERQGNPLSRKGKPGERGKGGSATR